MMYVNFIFISVFIGYSIGTAPVISYHFGAKNKAELQSLLKKSIVIIGAASAFMLLLSQLLAYPLSAIFVSYDTELLDMTCSGFRIFSASFLMSGFAIFGSSFFTALNDGLTSALISFLRTLLFQVGAILLLPLIWGINGIWLSVVAAEVMAVAATALFIFLKRKKYGYL
jgi:Na+-driven multidrug efflux pump